MHLLGVINLTTHPDMMSCLTSVIFCLPPYSSGQLSSQQRLSEVQGSRGRFAQRRLEKRSERPQHEIPLEMLRPALLLDCGSTKKTVPAWQFALYFEISLFETLVCSNIY